MKSVLHRFVREEAASSAAEFALVMPLLLIFLLGLVDAGRFMWEWNRAEKATQMGVRYAVVTDMVPTALASYNFATGSILPGDPIPSTSFGGVKCALQTGSTTDVGCSCIVSPCGPGTLIDNQTTANTRFNKLVALMQLFFPKASATTVKIDYDYSGLGFAGDPSGPNVAPLVRVYLSGVQFQPILFTLFGGTVSMPSFSAALTMEDGKGSKAN